MTAAAAIENSSAVRRGLLNAIVRRSEASDHAPMSSKLRSDAPLRYVMRRKNTFAGRRSISKRMPAQSAHGSTPE